MCLTARDRAIFRDLDRFGVASVAQLQRQHFPQATDAGTVARRLRHLVDAGYVEYLRATRTSIGVYRLRAAGLVALGIRSRRPASRRGWLPVYLWHHLAVRDVADWYLAKRWSDWTPVWVTERELRDGAVPWFIPEGQRGRSFLPDGVLVLADPETGEACHRMAIEVELHDKAAARYAPKVTWYRRRVAAGDFDCVRWLVGDDASGRVVQQAILAAQATDVMDVQRLPPGVTRCR